ncbi:hypothetical protein ACKWTF_012734 [Chironomus riparius]
MEKFLLCLALELGAKLIGWWHLINAICWTSVLSYFLFPYITSQLAVMMIYVLSLLVFALYIKRCVDLIQGAKQCDFFRVNNFKSMLLIFIAIFTLQLSWIVLTHRTAFPVPKMFLIIFTAISLVIEIYSFLVLDAFGLKLQEILSSRTAEVV